MVDETTSQANTEDATTPDSEVNPEVKADLPGDQVQETADLFYGDEEEKPKEGEVKEELSSEEAEEKEEVKEDSEKESEDAEKEDDKEDLEYSVDMPEESRLSEADKERIESYAKEQGLGKEAAQKLVDQQSEARDSYFEDLQKQHNQLKSDWYDKSSQDKEIGGEGFGENAEHAKRAIARFGTEDLKKDLESSGYGNHPEVIRVFARIGKAMANDTLVRGGSHSGGDRPMEDIFYGNKT